MIVRKIFLFIFYFGSFIIVCYVTGNKNGGGSHRKEIHFHNNINSSDGDFPSSGGGGRKSNVMQDFDWRAYLEFFPDLAKAYSTRDEAILHYMSNGIKERRKFPKLWPSRNSFKVAQKKLKAFLKFLDSLNVDNKNRNFVLYYMDDVSSKYSYEITVNNLMIFNHSIVMSNLDFSEDYWKSLEGNNRNSSSDVPTFKPRNEANPYTFYWFNVVKGLDNILKPYIPSHLKNVAEVYWDITSPSDLFSHLRSLTFLRHFLEKFGTVTFSNQFVRGPLIGNRDEQWIKQYSNLLWTGNNGMIAPVITCNPTTNERYLETHFFMIRSSLVPVILTEFMSGNKIAFPLYSVRQPEIPLRTKYEKKLTDIVLSNQYTVASYLYYTVLNKTTFDNHCLLQPSDPNPYDMNRWCELQGKEVIFMKWGGNRLCFSLFSLAHVFLLLSFLLNFPCLFLSFLCSVSVSASVSCRLSLSLVACLWFSSLLPRCPFR
jgi:hypothetical protein